MDEIDLVRRFRPATTIEVVEGAAQARAREALRQAMYAEGAVSTARSRTMRSGHLVPRLLLAAALALVLLSVPAFGLVSRFASWINSWKDPDSPAAIAADVVIAAGVSGVPWRVVATQTDQGLCLFTVYQYEGDRMGTGGCGWGADIYGYPSAAPRGYGAGGDELHWVEGSNGSGHSVGLNGRIVKGVTAERVASVDLELADGSTMHANLLSRPEGVEAPVNFWWMVLPAGATDVGVPIHALIARDSAGTVLERRIVDQPNG
jgi:hypothetical protein